MSSFIKVRKLKITDVQRRVLAALAQGATLQAAADANGIHRTTIFRWTRKHLAFERAMMHARRIHAQTVTDELRGLGRESIDVLRELLRSPDTPASVRCRAALAIIDATRTEMPEALRHSYSEEVELSDAIESLDEADIDAAATAANFRLDATCATAPAICPSVESAA